MSEGMSICQEPRTYAHIVWIMSELVIFRIPAWHMLIENRVVKMLQVFLIQILAWALVEGKCCHKEFECVL